MTTHNFFITGTDTNVGKTHVSVGLLKLFRQANYSTLGSKPIACGLENNAQIHADVLALQQHASTQLPIHLINAFTFKSAISPHLAAREENIFLSVDSILEKLNVVLQHPAQIKIIEGAGGWHVPLNDRETISDLARAINWPIILVVGMRLGCLNHAILTAQAIQAAKLTLKGWIANCIDARMPAQLENISTLKRWVNAPCLGIIPHQAYPEEQLKIDQFIL